MSGLHYLASPYSHPNPIIRNQRFDAACKAAAKLMQAGYVVFSPIAHSHPIEQHFGGQIESFDFWMKQDLAVLAASCRLMVLTLDGWEQSRGVAAELEYARKNAIPISFVEP